MPNQQEIAILRDMAKHIAELAAEERNQESVHNWTRLNALHGDVQPQVLVHLWALAWEEVLPDSELKCTSPMARRYERELRRAIWTAETLDSDNVVEPVVTYPLALRLHDYSGLDGGLYTQRRYAEGHGDGYELYYGPSGPTVGSNGPTMARAAKVYKTTARLCNRPPTMSRQREAGRSISPT
jgi:hypothetical protein